MIQVLLVEEMQYINDCKWPIVAEVIIVECESPLTELYDEWEDILTGPKCVGEEIQYEFSDWLIEQDECVQVSKIYRQNNWGDVSEYDND